MLNLCLPNVFFLLSIILQNFIGTYTQLGSQPASNSKSDFGGKIGVHTIWNESEEDELPPYKTYLRSVFSSEAQKMLPSTLGMASVLWEKNISQEHRKPRLRRKRRKATQSNSTNTNSYKNSEFKKHTRNGTAKEKNAEMTTIRNTKISYRKLNGTKKAETKMNKVSNRTVLKAVSSKKGNFNVSKFSKDVPSTLIVGNGSTLKHQRGVQLTVIGRKLVGKPAGPMTTAEHVVVMENKKYATTRSHDRTRPDHHPLYYKLSTTTARPCNSSTTSQDPDEKSEKMISSNATTEISIPAIESNTKLAGQVCAAETAPQQQCGQRDRMTTASGPSLDPTPEPVEAQPEIDFLNTSNIKIYIVPIQTTIRTIIQNDREFVMMETMAKYPVADELNAIEHWGDSARRELKWAHDRYNTDKQNPPVSD